MSHRKHVYTFEFNVPSDCHRDGKTDHFITAQVEWNEGSCYNNGKPIVINEGPVMSRLTNYDLRVLKNWGTIISIIEQIGQEHFASMTAPKNAVQLAEMHY